MSDSSSTLTSPTKLPQDQDAMFSVMSAQLAEMREAATNPDSGITDEQVAQFARTFSFLHGSFFRAAEANKMIAKSQLKEDVDLDKGKPILGSSARILERLQQSIKGSKDEEGAGLSKGTPIRGSSARILGGMKSMGYMPPVKRSKDEKMRERAVEALNERLNGITLPSEMDGEDEKPSVVIGKFI